MTHIRTMVALGILSVAIANGPARAETSPVPAILQQFTSTVATEREAGFYALLDLGTASLSAPVSSAIVSQQIGALLAAYPADAANIASALIALLSAENAAPETGLEEMITPDPAIETNYGLYYADLVTAVVALNDVRSLPLLAPLTDTGNMVINRVVSFGPPALDAVLTTTYRLEPLVRDGATFALLRMLDSSHIALFNDPTSLSKIRAGLIRVKSLATLPSMASRADGGLQTLPPLVPGDLNGDGKVNCDDLAIIRASFHKEVGQPGFDIRADLNGDGVVNGKDARAFRKLVGHELECDKYDDDGE